MIKYPVRLICESISDCEWFYNHYKHIYISDVNAKFMLNTAEYSIRDGGRYQIIIGGFIGHQSKIGYLIGGCGKVCDMKNCFPFYECGKISKLPIVKVKDLIREEKLRRILNGV